MTDTTTAPRPDERIKKVSRWRRAMIHPELGGICGTVLTGLFFANAESSLFRVFLGMILLIAVIMNTYIRRITTGER